MQKGDEAAGRILNVENCRKKKQQQKIGYIENYANRNYFVLFDLIL